MKLTILLALGLACLAGCAGTASVGMLPASRGAQRPELGRFVALEVDGIRGGALSVHLRAEVDDVLAALLDFDEADGHRSWAESFELVDAGEDSLGRWRVARWDFRGKLGISPSVTIEFRPERHADGASVAFELVDGALGLRTFEGSYVLEPTADGGTWFTQHVFLSSGLAFVDASHDDIAAGLREDARRLVAWLAEREATRRGDSTATI